MTITLKKLEELTKYEGNAKLHGATQVAAIAASIEEFGFTQPILIDETNTILAGHGRLAAAKLIGLTEVPCIVLEGLTEEKRRAYILADNRLSEIGGGWDEEKLKAELESIEESFPNFDLDLTGFDFNDRRDLLAIEDLAPEEVKPAKAKKKCPHCNKLL